MSERTLIISDTHMARRDRPVSSPRLLRPLWEGFDHLVINGDTVEIPIGTDPGPSELIDELHELCGADDMALTLIAGNHDPHLSELRHLMLWEGRILLTHGDVLHPAIAPWALNARHLVRTTYLGLRRMRHHHRRLDDRLEAHRASARFYWTHLANNGRPFTALREFALRPWAVATMLYYWWKVPSMADELAAQHAPYADFIILGHTHRAGIWEVGKRVVINTGCFPFPGRPLAVAVDESSVCVHRIQRGRDGHYRLVPQPIRRFERGRGGRGHAPPPIPRRRATDPAPATDEPAAS